MGSHKAYRKSGYWCIAISPILAKQGHSRCIQLLTHWYLPTYIVRYSFKHQSRNRLFQALSRAGLLRTAG